MAQAKAKKQAKLVQTEKIVRKTHFSITADIRIEQARQGIRLVTQKEIDELKAKNQLIIKGDHVYKERQRGPLDNALAFKKA